MFREFIDRHYLYSKETEMTKKIMVLSATLAMALFGILGCAAQEYKIGDTGPAGGTIFYVRADAPKGEWRYLEAAPADLLDAEWGAYEKDIGGTEERIGSGKKNTELIVAKLKELGESGRAAQLCAEYETNGYKDWFLPSKDELELMYLMYKNLKANSWGDFRDDEYLDLYWSSSEVESTRAWLQGFSNGSTDRNSKDDSYYVRAVRAF
jgi:hypothetical protein